MVCKPRYAYTYALKKDLVHKDLKTKKIDLKIYFFGFFEKPPWEMLLGSWMPSFIEVTRLENCEQSGCYGWKENKTRHP